MVPLKNVPIEVAGGRNVVTDPHRVAEITAELRKKVAYIKRSYELWRLSLGIPNAFNEQLAALRDQVKRGDFSQPMPRHIELRLVITHWAGEHARDRGINGPPHPEDFAAGKREAVRRLRARNHRPKDRVLKLHLGAVVALIQESTGVPVLVTKKKDHQYAPQAANAMGQLAISLIRQIDPAITVTAIVDAILKVRKKYAGRSMRFEMFMPGYGVTITPF